MGKETKPKTFRGMNYHRGAILHSPREKKSTEKREDFGEQHRRISRERRGGGSRGEAGDKNKTVSF